MCFHVLKPVHSLTLVLITEILSRCSSFKLSTEARKMTACLRADNRRSQTLY